MQKPSNRRSVIKNSSSSAAAIFETCSNSTQQSISTQTSVYAPAFNPQSRMNSDDWYDSRNDSDTSVPHYGPPFVNRGFGIDLPTQQPVMPGLTRCNSGQLSESDSGQSFTSKSSLRNKSRNYNGSILRRSTGGYGSQSDVSSTHSIPISGNNLRPRTPPKRNDHGDAGVTYDAFSSTSSMYRETPKAIPFKKRNLISIWRTIVWRVSQGHCMILERWSKKDQRWGKDWIQLHRGKLVEKNQIHENLEQLGR